MADVLTTTPQFPVFSVRSLQSKYKCLISLLPLLIFFFHQCEGILISLFSPNYPNKTLLSFAYPIFPIHLILPDLITRIIYVSVNLMNLLMLSLPVPLFPLPLWPNYFPSHLTPNSFTFIVKTKLEAYKQQQAN
jgi:hypothetical protein